MERHSKTYVRVKFHIKILLDWQTILVTLSLRDATLVVHVQVELKYSIWRPNVGLMNKTILIFGEHKSPLTDLFVYNLKV